MHTQDAGANSYVASIKDSPSTKMGILHAVYGMSQHRTGSHTARSLLTVAGVA